MRHPFTTYKYHPNEGYPCPSIMEHIQNHQANCQARPQKCKDIQHLQYFGSSATDERLLPEMYI